MSIQEHERLSDRVYALLGGLGAVESTAPVGPDTQLAAIGFDSLACAELAALVHQELGVDVVDRRLAGLKRASEIVAIVEETSLARGGPREPYPRGMGRGQGFAKVVVGAFSRWWFTMEITGAERVLARGPVVLCMNHESLLDIPLAVVASPRPIRFMAKQELFAKAAGARFFHWLGGFPVERDQFDLRAIDTGLEVLRRGEVLGMYPEGTRTPGTLLPFLPGAAWIASKIGATLVPCAISGTGAAMPKEAKFFKRVPIRIAFGEPVPAERIDDPAQRRARAVELTQQVRDAVESMWRP